MWQNTMVKGRLSFLVVLICNIEISISQNKVDFKCYNDRREVVLQCEAGKTIQILDAKWTIGNSAYSCSSNPSLCQHYPLDTANTCHGQQRCSLSDGHVCSNCPNLATNCAHLTYRCADCSVESCSLKYTTTTRKPTSTPITIPTTPFTIPTTLTSTPTTPITTHTTTTTTTMPVKPTTTSTTTTPSTSTAQLEVNTVSADVTSNGNRIFSMDHTSSLPDENTVDVALPPNSNNSTKPMESDGQAIGPMIGGVIGGTCLIIIVIIVTIYLIKRRKNNSSSNGNEKLNNMQMKNTNGHLTDFTDPMDTYDEAIPVNNGKGFGKMASKTNGNNFESVDQTYDEAIPNYKNGNEVKGIKNDFKPPNGETLYSDVNENKGNGKKLKKKNNKEKDIPAENIDDNDDDDEPLEMYAVVTKKPSEKKTKSVPPPTVDNDSDSDQEPPPAPPKLNTDSSAEIYENA